MMKTISTLKSEMEEVLSEMKAEKSKSYVSEKESKKSDRIIAKLKNKLSHLRLCLMYIESNPSIEFVRKEAERITNRINAFMDNYIAPENWAASLRSKHKREYENEMGIPKLRKQLSTIHFILK